jgi:hypothetical protein
MFEIKVSQEIKDACPVFAGAAVYAAVKNTAYCEGLWKEINAFTEELTTTRRHQTSACHSCHPRSLQTLW